MSEEEDRREERGRQRLAVLLILMAGFGMVGLGVWILAR